MNCPASCATYHVGLYVLSINFVVAYNMLSMRKREEKWRLMQQICSELSKESSS